MAKRIVIWMAFLLNLFPLFAQKQNATDTYAELESTIPIGTTLKDSVLHFFTIADGYMDLDQYDSAELWLSKVGDRLEFKKPGIFNYYYHSRQAEVFYYNNLLQIGLQQTNRALQIALQLKDSFFIADAYNFLGLFSLNLEKFKEAEMYLKNGLRFCRDRVSDNYHLVLSEPHHLHGNLGETYVKLGEYAKALIHFDSSIQKAKALNSQRAQGLGYISAGEALMEIKLYDSAFSCIQKGLNIALDNKDNDVALYGYGNLAELYAQMHERAFAYKTANEGLAFQQVQHGLNPFYTLLFMRRLVEMYNTYNDYKNVAAIQKKIMETERSVRKKSNLQMESVLSAGLNNENKLLQFEIQEVREKQSKSNLQAAFLLVIIALMLLGIFYYRNALKQKLAMAEMREKISRNLHDDIGATISSLHIYSSLAQSSLDDKPIKAKEMLERISEQSKTLMENMNDMVWSMKANEDDAMTLNTRIINFGAELLTAKNIQCKYKIDEDAFRCFKNYDDRKNILLILKEGLNNIAKYSDATQALVSLEKEPNHLAMEIWDNGIGFEPLKTNNGNGLKNMQARAKALKGSFNLITTPGNGTRLRFHIPIP
jgi:signal transduction histidine kinase